MPLLLVQRGSQDRECGLVLGGPTQKAKPGEATQRDQ